MSPRFQTTLHRSASICGRGYWSGKSVEVTFEPAAADTGIVFRRDDLPGRPAAPVNPRTVDGAHFRTNVNVGDDRVELIEHAVAALAGMQIDNVLIAVTAREMPGLDGSAAGYVEMIRHAGTRTLQRPRGAFRIAAPLRIVDGDAWIAAEPNDNSVYGYELDYDDGPIRRQSYACQKTIEHFGNHLAAARTFVTADQAAKLRQSGVGLHVTTADLVMIDEDGRPIDTTWRMADECAAHKTLDLIGDLAVVGVDLIGRMTSHRGGHRLNAQMARKIAEQIAGAAAGENCYTDQAA